MLKHYKSGVGYKQLFSSQTINSTHLLVFLSMMSSEGFGTYIAIVVILLFVLCAVCTAPLSVSITMYIIVGLVVNVILPCPTLHLLFPLCLVTVLVPVFISSCACLYSYNCLYGTSHCKSYFL